MRIRVPSDFLEGLPANTAVTVSRFLEASAARSKGPLDEEQRILTALSLALSRRTSCQ